MSGGDVGFSVEGVVGGVGGVLFKSKHIIERSEAVLFLFIYCKGIVISAVNKFHFDLIYLGAVVTVVFSVDGGTVLVVTGSPGSAKI